MRDVMIGLILIHAIGAGQDARSVLDKAVQNMGNPNSIQITGSGAVFTVGQNLSPGKPWPRVEMKSFTRVIDYQNAASRNDAVGAQGPAPSQFFAAGRAWGQAPNGTVTAQPAAAAERGLQIWMTPHGFLKAALAGSATAKSRKVGGRKVTEISVMKGAHRLTGTISGDNLVERVEARLYNPVLGDMLVSTVYEGYKQSGDIKFPAKAVQSQGGYPALELNIAEARANVAVNIAAPDTVRTAAVPAVKVASEKLADGVWYLTGGSHHSVVVEYRDHLAVIEAPLNEERSLAVISEAKKLVPNKPVRYLVNTHHHFDHSGGLRTYIAEGAAIVTHGSNAAFYQGTAKAAHTLNPDRQSREKKKLKVVSTGSSHTLSDGARTMEIHHIQGSPHNDGILMAWLPKERILVEVDVYSPAPPNAPAPATPSPATVNLLENIERLKLDVDRIAPLHGRMVTLADLRKAAGK